jgi:hypothetical protein
VRLLRFGIHSAGVADVGTAVDLRIAIEHLAIEPGARYADAI